MDFTVPEFDIERNRDRCTLCGACVKECSYKVHFFSKDKKAVLADEKVCGVPSLCRDLPVARDKNRKIRYGVSRPR